MTASMWCAVVAVVGTLAGLASGFLMGAWATRRAYRNMPVVHVTAGSARHFTNGMRVRIDDGRVTKATAGH